MTGCSPAKRSWSSASTPCQPQSVYNGFTDSDRLSLAATERFLDVTHRQYAARCTEFSSIRGVFTDEPHRGMVFSDFSDPGEERRWSLPWTDNLPEAFEAAYGEPLLPASAGSCFCFCAGSRFQG